MLLSKQMRQTTTKGEDKMETKNFIEECKEISKEFISKSDNPYETIGRMSAEILRLRNELKKEKDSK